MGRIRITRWVVAVALVWVAVAGFAKEPPTADRPVRLLLKPRPEVLAQRGGELAIAHAALGGRVRHQYPRLRNLEEIELPPGTDARAAVDFYTATGLFEYVETDHEVQAFATPNDPSFLDGTLWALRNLGQNGGTSNADIRATAAWDIRTSANPVVVAVIDSGIRYTHEDLASNMWVNPGEIAGNGIDDDGDGIIDDVHGFNATASTNSPAAAGDPWDDYGHGTHVAGIIGAMGNNGIGVVGVAWRVRLMACKFISASGSGRLSDGIACVDYAVAHGARVINASWGCLGCYSLALSDAIAAAGEAGVVFVAAAGNAATSTDDTPFYPADYVLDNLVSVAATDRNDLLASFSNFGPEHVGLGAPGVDILSTFNSDDEAYAIESGTSMAAPYVSGALALLAARFPHDSPTDLIGRLLGNVDPLSSLAGKCVTGGRLNLFRALTRRPLPVARFASSALGGEPALTVTFTNESLNAVKSLWDFGDGSRPSHQRTPTHTFSDFGTYTVTLTASDSHGTPSCQSKTVTVAPNYHMFPGNFSWVDPGGMSRFSLYDDDLTSSQPLPFPFEYYGKTNTSIVIGSNGMLGFNGWNMTEALNTDIPSPFTPNDMLYPLWTDLDPSAAGSVYFGSIGTAPHRIAVISWVGVPHWNDPDGTFTFQALLFEGRNDIVFQYLDVNPGNLTNGAGRTATVGIENANGSIARKYSFNGSALLTNGQAIAFTMSTEPPPPVPPPLPATPILWAAQPMATNRIDLSWSAVAEADAYIVFRGGTSILTTTNTVYSDIGLPPDATFCYSVTATNRGGSSPASSPACGTTLSLPTFAMDGSADSAGYLQRADGMTLYAAVRGQTLYIATQSPGTNPPNDYLILVSDGLDGLPDWSAPLQKAGFTAVNTCSPVLVATNGEGTVGWNFCGLPADQFPQFPAAMSPTTTGVMEGAIDLLSWYGYLPDTIYIAVAVYTPGPGSTLVAQTPPGNGDGNLDANEFLAIPLATILDNNSDGIYDDLSPP